MPNPPAGFQATDTPAGGVDLRIAGKGRGCLVVGGFALALVWSGAVIRDLASNQALPLGTSPATATALGLLPILFSLWCAFADEVWHVEQNSMEHRVGIGTLCYRRSYHDAQLELSTFTNRYGHRFYRLHAVTARARHFLMERNEETQVRDFAEFIAAYAGWQVH